MFSPHGDRIAFSDDRHYSDHCCFELFSIGLFGNHEQRLGGLQNPGAVNVGLGLGASARPPLGAARTD